MMISIDKETLLTSSDYKGRRSPPKRTFSLKQCEIDEGTNDTNRQLHVVLSSHNTANGESRAHLVAPSWEVKD